MNKTQAWIKLLRLSNMPTIISNSMVGLGLGMVAHSQQWEDKIVAPRFIALKMAFIISFSLLCAYFGGLVLNDAVDVKHDKQYRPERPIPSGIISKRKAWIVGTSLLSFALLLSLFTQVQAAIFMVLLIGCIFADTFLHRFLLLALLFMSLCRGLVFVVAFSAFDVEFQTEPLFCFSIGIAWYTLVLTLIARIEPSNNTSTKWMVLLFLPSAIVPAIFYSTDLQMIYIFGSLLVFILWMAFTFFLFAINTTKVNGIHAILAGFCFLDCLYLSILGEIHLAIISGICFLFTIASQRKIIGT